MKKKTRILMLCTLGSLLLVVLAAGLWRLWQVHILKKIKISRQTTYITSPLTRDGEVNYRA